MLLYWQKAYPLWTPGYKYGKWTLMTGPAYSQQYGPLQSLVIANEMH